MSFELKNVQVGQRTVLASITNLIVPAGEKVEFDVLESGSSIAVCKIYFDDDANETSLSYKSDQNGIVLTLNKWIELTRALAAPLKIGSGSENRDVTILVSNVRVGSTNLLSVQFMIDGKTT